MLRFSMTERGAEARRAPLAPRLLLGISLGGLHAHMAARPHAHGVNGYAHWDMITGEKEAAGDGLSVCEQLELEGSSHVGRATVFVIWNLGSPVATLIGALEDYVASRGLDRARTFFWISNLMLRRGSKQLLEHDLATLDCFLRPIEAIGRTAFLLHPWGADAFRRLWSLWELYLSHHSCAGLELLCPPSVAKQLVLAPSATCRAALAAVEQLDVLESQIGWSDQVRKRRFLAKVDSLGGAASFNRDVTRSVRVAIARLRELAEQGCFRAVGWQPQQKGEGQMGQAPPAAPVPVPVAATAVPFARTEDAAAYGERVLGRGAARRAVERLTFAHGASVLDVGCGDGGITRALAERFPGCSFVGVDVSSAMIEYAHRHHGGRVGLRFARDDAATLATVPDESVDVLVSVSATHWVFDQAAMWAAFRRVLKPGGTLDVSSYPYNEAEYEPLRRVAATPKWAPTFAHFASDAFGLEAPLAHVQSVPVLRQTLVDLGYEVTTCEVTTHRYKIADTGEYAKMLVPWHPWIAHVPAGPQRDDFVADMRREYRRYVGMEGADEATPLPFTFGTLEVRAVKKPAAPPPALPAPPSASAAAQQGCGRRAVFSMVSPECTLPHFAETDVDYARPENSAHMVTVSVPLREFSQGEVDFHTHGFALLRLSREQCEQLSAARAIALKAVGARSTAERRYMENNFNAAGVKGYGAAKAFERVVAEWAEQAFDTPCVAVASASIKMRDSGGAADAIVPQPHVHVDYATYAAAMRRLRDPPEWPDNLARRVSPPATHLLEVINLWLPCTDEPVRDWGFGFVTGGSPRHVPVKLNGVEWSLNTQLRQPEKAAVWTAREMRWGDAYVFRSVGAQYAPPHATPRETFAPPHTAFRVAPPPAKPFRRVSMEVRVAIYRRPSNWQSKL